MSDYTALVFDTNFIVQNQKLDKVLSNLQDGYKAYVTQVSVEERIAQQCREIKYKIDSISKIQSDYRGLATIKLTTTYDKKATEIRKAVQSAYDRTFGDDVIPLDKDEKVYADVLERALMKIPPFLSEEKVDGKSNGKSPSDKGFKDALIWISMLRYFKDFGEQKVIFLTEDAGFKNQATRLCAEFESVTGKTIEIRDNSYIRELSKKDESSSEEIVTPKEPLPDVRQLRERISVVVNAICGFEVEGDWGEPEWIRYFTIDEMVDISYVAVVLSGLEDVISQNIFNKTVPAYNVLSLDDRVTNGNYAIPITAVEDLAKLHNDLQKKYPQNIQQFYSTVASIINENYVAPKIIRNVFDGDLPF